MSIERRKRYRVRRNLKTLSFRVYVSGGGSAGVLNLSSSGIALSLVGGDDPQFVVDATVGIRFAFADRESCSLGATVRWHRRETGGHVYGVEFIDPEILHKSLPVRLFELFNRREWRRSTALELRETRVCIRQESHKLGLKGHLLDISAGGSGLMLDGAPTLSLGARLELSFALRSLQSDFNLVGVVVSVESADQQVRCGVKFDPHASSEFAVQQEQLITYVAGEMG